MKKALLLGNCMIEASKPYSEQLIHDHNIDFARIDKQGERLGQLIGAKMASVCPTELMDFAKNMSKSSIEEKENKTDTENKIKGVITSIETKDFVTITIKEPNGNFSTYLWLYKPKSYLDLISNYKNLNNKSILLSFEEQELFDWRASAYRIFKVIKSINYSN